MRLARRHEQHVALPDLVLAPLLDGGAPAREEGERDVVVDRHRHHPRGARLRAVLDPDRTTMKRADHPPS